MNPHKDFAKLLKRSPETNGNRKDLYSKIQVGPELHVGQSNIVKPLHDLSDIRNALVPFSSAPAEFEHHRNTNKHQA